MLAFFRKHQRIFFLFITIIIIVTFVFFGTYNTLSTSNTYDETAFEAVDGKKIKQSYLQQMSHFLRSDGAQSITYGLPRQDFFGNFLNDGVVVKDFLQTGVAQVVFQYYQKEISADLESHLEKERHFSGYSHPFAAFISAENVWESFAPQLFQSFKQFKEIANPFSEEAFKARVDLYLAERSFPPLFLKQVLLYQEKQYEWLPKDQNLMREGLSLFDYKDLQDWFGSHFIDAVSQVVINGAAIAKQKGYSVKKDEALAEIFYLSQKTYQALKERKENSFKNGSELLREYLRLTQIDENTLVKIWQDILLFRRLLSDVGSSVLIDELAMNQFSQYAGQSVEIELTQFEKPLLIKNYQDLQAFEAYLSAISETNDDLLLPETFFSIEQIEKKHPELVETRYWVEIAHLNKSDLETKISVNDTWAWEIEENNFVLLKDQFPQLQFDTDSKQQRFQLLEKLEDKVRKRVDQFARKAILSSHPEWVDQALSELAFHEEILALPGKGKCSLEGIQNASELAKLLDQSEVGQIVTCSEDEVHFYRFKLKEKSSVKNCLTFNEALQKGILTKLSKHFLNKNSEALEKKLMAIQKECQKQDISLSLDQKDELAQYRLIAHMQKASSLASEGKGELLYESQEPPTNSFLVKSAIQDQWKLKKVKKIVSREKGSELNVDEILAKEKGYFSPIMLDGQQGLYFYQFINETNDSKITAQKTEEYRQLLASEAKCQAVREFLDLIQEKKAICLK